MKRRTIMYVLGYDIGSSSVKASLVNIESGEPVASAFYPKEEMKIEARFPGWAEQNPEMWWQNLKLATHAVRIAANINPSDIKAIGISYQMHGLVAVDKNYNVIRPSIIWCDSRAVETGAKAFSEIGENFCLEHLLNSPGNFTASKLKWVKENEPEVYDNIYKIMLPGDYIAMRLTGEIRTTMSGLSEGMFWDIKEHEIASFLIDHYGIDRNFLPEIVDSFGPQGYVTKSVAEELGLAEGTMIAYRAGDQPNNALSLNVLNPGEIAATAGTSGVVYGISDKVQYDPLSRINTFVHVNHSRKEKRLGVLLCINGTGILNSWLKKNMLSQTIRYEDMNEMAATVPVGSGGLLVLPFGNGAERMLANRNPGAGIKNLNFNIHKTEHILRASQEGIVFSFRYGMELMKEVGIRPSVIRAGHANMFLSKIFRDTLAGVSGATLELYDTDGAQGAAKGAGIGAGIYANAGEAFAKLKKIETVEPDPSQKEAYTTAYYQWREYFDQTIM